MTTIDRRVYYITEFAKMAGIGKALAYTLAKENRLGVPVIQIGKRLVIPKRAADALLAGLTQPQAKPEEVNHA